jgi:hypothetical protein
VRSKSGTKIGSNWGSRNCERSEQAPFTLFVSAFARSEQAGILEPDETSEPTAQTDPDLLFAGVLFQVEPPSSGLCDMMDIERFRSEHVPTDSVETSQSENDYTLDVAVDGSVPAKTGSMIAHDGDLSFTGRASTEGGITGFLKEAATGEGTPVMAIEGDGHAYLADRGRRCRCSNWTPTRPPRPTARASSLSSRRYPAI